MNFAINNQNEIYFNAGPNLPGMYFTLLNAVLLSYRGRPDDKSWGLSIFTREFEEFLDSFDNRYVVAIPGYETKIPKENECSGVTYHPDSLVEQWITRVIETITTYIITVNHVPEDVSIVGLWVDKGIAYVDYCQTFATEDEAMVVAREWKQLAIFDRYEQVAIDVPAS